MSQSNTPGGDAPHAPPSSGSPAAAPAPSPSPAAAPPPVHKERRARNVGWRSTDVLRTAALVIAMYVAVKLAWIASPVLFVAFLGLLFGLPVAAGADRLRRFGVPRAVGAALIVFSVIGALAGFGAYAAPTLREQGRELRQRLPEAIDAVEKWVDARRDGVFGLVLGMGGGMPTGATGATGAATPPAPTPAAQAPAAGTSTAGATTAAAQRPAPAPAQAADSTTQPAADGPISLRDRIGSQMSGATRYLFPFLSSTIAVVGGVLLVIVLSIYIGAEPDTYHAGLMHLFPHHLRARAGEVLSAIAIVLRKWMYTQMIAMAVIGVVTTAVLFALDVKAAVALGVLAGLLEFIPTIGPIISAVPAIAMGFLDSPEKALWVGVAYLAIQQAENHLLIPMLMKGAVNVPPALTILSQALMALVFGFLGLMIAVPLAAATLVPIKMLYVEDVVGDEVVVVGGEPDPGDDDDDD